MKKDLMDLMELQKIENEYEEFDNNLKNTDIRKKLVPKFLMNKY